MMVMEALRSLQVARPWVRAVGGLWVEHSLQGGGWTGLSAWATMQTALADLRILQEASLWVWAIAELLFRHSLQRWPWTGLVEPLNTSPTRTCRSTFFMVLWW